MIVLRASRLGREEIDLLTTYNLFVDLLGIELIGAAEPLGDRTMFGFQSIMAGYARRLFLADSARGMERAAKEGRYTGGIAPLGYRVDGRRQTARLIPDETIIGGNWGAADLVRRIYHWLGVDERSCRWIAHELNLLGVPTSYDRDGRGVRGKRTQGLWRPGRIRNLVVSADSLKNYFPGAIDEVVVYSSALSDAEIRQLVEVGPVGGIAGLPDIAAASVDEAGTPAGGSGWSARGYAALSAGLAAVVLGLPAGAWYARRHWLGRKA